MIPSPRPGTSFDAGYGPWAAAGSRAAGTGGATGRGPCPSSPPSPAPAIRPATPASVAAHAAARADAARPVATIQRQVAAIAHAHRAAGVVPAPTQDPLVRATLVGSRSLRGTAPTQTRPLTLPDLRQQCLDATAPATRAGDRDRALLLLGLAGGFRRSDLVGLDVDDVTPTPAGLQVRVRRSKTDQEGRGRDVGIPVGTHPATCPDRAPLGGDGPLLHTAGLALRWERGGAGGVVGPRRGVGERCQWLPRAQAPASTPPPPARGRRGPGPGEPRSPPWPSR